MIEQERLLLNPFPGLRPFETEENELFFGRDGQSDEVLSKLRAARFVAVVGTSGSGKSSLVRAGLLPALLSGHMTSAGSSWRVAIFRPGASPIANLASALSEPGVFGGSGDGEGLRLTTIERALRRSSLGLLEVVGQSGMQPHENLLILADQFEELFRFRKKTEDGTTEDEAAAFVKLLLEARQHGRPQDERLPIYVILTMRSDYLGDCAHFRGLPEAINDGQYLIPRMTDDDRREAINGPVILGGGRITAPLVNRLLNDAGEDPARLPILQHALMRTWDEWKHMGKEHRVAHAGDALDLCCYEAVGAMDEALSLHADEAWSELRGERERQIAETLFKRLTEKEADHREGRRPATLGEVCAVVEATTEEVAPVVECFRREGRSFLMPPPDVPLTRDTLIDISHESLIRGWLRLRLWVDEEAQSARQYKRLAETAAGYPKEEDFLRDPALSIGLKWLEDNKPTRAWAERYHPGFDKTVEYLEVSRVNREAEAAERERRQREKVEHAEAMATEQRKRVKQLRIMLALLSLLLLGMLGATVYAFQQKGVADTQSERAQRALKEAQVQRDAANTAKEEAVAANAETKKQRDRAEGALETARHERDNAVKAKSEAVKQRDAAQRATREADIQKKNAVTARDAAKQALDSALIAQAAAAVAKEDAERQRGVAEEQRKAAVEQRDEATKLLKLVDEIDHAADYSVSVMRGHTQGIGIVSFNRDDSTVVASTNSSGAYHGESRAWDPNTGKPKPALLTKDPTFKLLRVSYSESGKLMLLTGNFQGDTSTQIWDMEKNELLAQVRWTQLKAAWAVVSPDDRFIIIADMRSGASGSLAVHDARTGEELRRLEGSTGIYNRDRFRRVAFSPDGNYVAGAGPGAFANVWDVATGKQFVELRGHINDVTSVSFSPDGKYVLTVAGDDGAWLWDARSGKIVLKLIGHDGPVNSAAFSPDGRLVVTTSKNRAYLWEQKGPNDWTDVSENSPTYFDGHEREVTNAVFTRDSKWVVTISEDRTARVWRAKTEPYQKEKDDAGVVSKRPATVASRAVFRGHIKPLTSVAVSRKDSRYVVTGSEDGTARVWSLEGVDVFRVGEVAVLAEQPDYKGKCPVSVKFKGEITSEGGAGTVKYRFIRSDGNPTVEEELTFDAPGMKEVGYSLDVSGSRFNRRGDDIPTAGWVKLQIIEPAAKSSKQAAYSVTCDESFSQQSTPGELTDAQLKQIMPASKDENRGRYLPEIRKAMAEFGINTPTQQAAFLAAVAVNTADLTIMSEPEGKDADYFEKLYGMRKDLGNFSPGDGAKYKGRGAFLITGRTLYQSLSKAVGVDLVNYPDRAAEPDVAFRTAALMWQRYGMNEAADAGDIKRVARVTTSGLRQLEKLTAYFERAKAALGGTSPRQ
jgi:WD40 repeat protein/predicted chitinase